jgi:hypothetical protein
VGAGFCAAQAAQVSSIKAARSSARIFFMDKLLFFFLHLIMTHGQSQDFPRKPC